MHYSCELSSKRTKFVGYHYIDILTNGDFGCSFAFIDRSLVHWMHSFSILQRNISNNLSSSALGYIYRLLFLSSFSSFFFFSLLHIFFLCRFLSEISACRLDWLLSPPFPYEVCFTTIFCNNLFYDFSHNSIPSIFQSWIKVALFY